MASAGPRLSVVRSREPLKF